MILWVNCKITDVRVSNLHCNMRQNLRHEKRFDVAKYTFASYGPWEPFITKILFNLELDENYLGREKEMEDWIYSIFPSHKVRIQWFRCNYLHQWKIVQEEINSINDDIVYLVGNDDHVFFDSSTNILEKGLEYLKNDLDPTTMLGVCHYPEILRESFNKNGKLTACGNFVQYKNLTSVNVFIFNKKLFNMYMIYLKDPNKIYYKTDGITIDFISNIYTSTKEICRHFDGYAHVGTNSNHCPPLEIPPGFFDHNIKIKYGYANRYSEYVNINPLASTLYAADKINGTDYKFLLDDIPKFWKPYISNIDVNPNIEVESAVLSRDRHYLDIATAEFNGSRTPIPFQWIQNHMLTLQPE